MFDSGLGDQDRIIVFSSPKMRSLLRECNSLYTDGTFKIVPDHFLQLYTLHVEKDGFLFPCVYALMTSKVKKTIFGYSEFEPAFNLAAIIVDFEKAVKCI